jgi:hypothetical protein
LGPQFLVHLGDTMFEFKLGFATLATLIPDEVGDPLEEERYAANGDSQQLTTGGLMVWRKADNWTAFTDGHRTWVNGPYGLQVRLNTERFDWEGAEDARAKRPLNPARRFGVWNGVAISREYSSLAVVAAAVRALCPQGRWYLEWLVKAGEVDWQSRWDSHPLAIDGPAKLKALYQEGRRLRPALKVTPYFVIRGRPQWIAEEHQKIALAASITGRVVLNLEEGERYWNGPTDPEQLRCEYLDPLARMIRTLAPRRRVQIQIGAIPREWVVRELGGDPAIDEWARFAGAMSWECYGAAARDLMPDVAMARVRQWLSDVPKAKGPAYYVPIVQRSMIAQWAGSPECRDGMEVWHLGGDL